MSIEVPDVIRPSWAAPSSVRVLNTTRLGGVSAAPYDSLNLGLHVNDDEASVRANRASLIDSGLVPTEPVWLNQVHGCDVVTVTDTVNAAFAAADAAVTDVPGRVLSIMTADCLPVAITNDSGTRLAVAHAGWKGLAKGVIEASLDAFEPADELHVWLGPAIGPDRFEVGPEVRETFVSVDPVQEAFFTEQADGSGRYLANLYALAHRIIDRHRAGSAPVQVTGGDFCTHTDDQRFHSYRRDGSASGRMALLAWLQS